MKKIFLFILLFITSTCFSQSDSNGNPVFNSISTNEEVINDFKLLSNYYTLKNNIDNKLSSVYISEHPDIDQIINAAINLPSDFFVISKNQNVVNMLLIINQPSRKILVLNPTSNKKIEFKCSLKGDISENRANEIIENNYDPNAKIENGKLIFNDKKFKIISNKEIKETILDLISKEELSKTDSSNIKILSKEELRIFILKETKEGGKLDFFTPIKGKEYNAIQVKPGLIATYREIAFYKWGKACYDLGVNTLEDALSIFAEFKGRELNLPERESIKSGFERGLEK